jgi:hypothetical protein
MKSILAAALLVFVLAAMVFYVRTTRVPSHTTPALAPETQAAVRTATPAARPVASVSQTSNAAVSDTATSTVAAAQASSPETGASRPPVPGALLFGGPESTPVNLPGETVLENVRSTVRSYGSMFEGNPVGTNPEITAALNGENAKGVHFLEAEKGMRVNRQGELVDPWGTPFFFHQLSGSETEIRSAGPDKQMWTADDLVIK